MLLISVVGAVGDDLNVDVPQHPQCYNRACPTEENCGGEKKASHVPPRHTGLTCPLPDMSILALCDHCQASAVRMQFRCAGLVALSTKLEQHQQGSFIDYIFPFLVGCRSCAFACRPLELKKEGTYNVECFVHHVKTTCKTNDSLFEISNKAMYG